MAGAQALYTDGGVIQVNPSPFGGTWAISESDTARFWGKVQTGAPDECWPWLKGRHSKGYGVFFVRSRNIGAHRFALMTKLGRDLQPGYQACHSCDNPICCNPAHLYEGSAADNTHDMMTKGRNGYKLPATKYGERHPGAKLTVAKVQEIRARKAAGETNASIARRLGVARKTITKVLQGETWQDV